MLALLVISLALLAVGLMGPLYRPRCPECRAPAQRVIHTGAPMWFCFAHEMPIAFGLLSGLLGTALPFDGMLWPVPGPYLPGLWTWWRATRKGSP